MRTGLYLVTFQVGHVWANCLSNPRERTFEEFCGITLGGMIWASVLGFSFFVSRALELLERNGPRHVETWMRSIRGGAITWEALWAPYDGPTYRDVLSRLQSNDVVLEIGAGDLRLARQIAQVAKKVFGN